MRPRQGSESPQEEQGREIRKSGAVGADEKLRVFLRPRSTAHGLEPYSAAAAIGDGECWKKELEFGVDETDCEFRQKDCSPRVSGQGKVCIMHRGSTPATLTATVAGSDAHSLTARNGQSRRNPLVF
jgi:hypothetical protein